MPIPLAMMPAFMAYQSMLMGDSFGQAYQYGKRKISAMSNEEFNKLSISQLYKNVTIEYDRMIPDLQQSIKNSQQLQNFIVKELLAIIPNLLSEVFGGSNEEEIDRYDTDSPFFKNTSATQQQSPVTLTRYTTDRQPIYNEKAIKDAQDFLKEALTGAPGSVLDVRAQNKATLDARKPYIAPTREATSAETINTNYVLQEIKLQKLIIENRKQLLYISTGSVTGRAARIATINANVARARTALQKFYFSFRGYNQLSSKNKNHNAQAISTRAWTKY